MDFSQLSVGKKIAKGADSRIYHGLYSNKSVAVKILQHQNQQDESLNNNDDEEKRIKKLFDSEVKLLSRIRHTNVVEIVASCSKTPLYCILTEFCSEGSLRSYLNKFESSNTRLPMEKVIDIGLQIARGMEYVHSQGVIHRDIKPDNVLIDHNFRLKVADFGASCEENRNDFRDVGALRWMAPEMIAREKYGRKVDVYSFGMILFEMVLGSIPFGSMSPFQVALGVANDNLRPEIPEDCPEFMRGLIERCCSKNLKNRPEFSEIVKVLEAFHGRRRRSSQTNKKGLFFYLINMFCTSA